MYLYMQYIYVNFFFILSVATWFFQNQNCMIIVPSVITIMDKILGKTFLCKAVFEVIYMQVL